MASGDPLLLFCFNSTGWPVASRFPPRGCRQHSLVTGIDRGYDAVIPSKEVRFMIAVNKQLATNSAKRICRLPAAE
jgi:hypothetical protein